MFKWKKLGLIFNPRLINRHDWMHEFAQAPCAIEYDDFIRIYFSTRSKPDKKNNYVSYPTFADFSKDGTFKLEKVSDKPILPLGETGCFDEFGIYPISVIKHEQFYRAYYAGWTRCESVPFNVAIGCAFSNDGETFEKIGSGPVLSYSIDEPFILSGPKIRKYNDYWMLFYISGTKWIKNNKKVEPVYKIRMATSKDGLNWEKLNRDIIESKLDENECQASPDVFKIGDNYHMLFSYRNSDNYRSGEGSYRIGYAFSNDLINWQRNDELAGIEPSESGWDAQMISYPNILFLNEDVYLFYMGNEFGKNGFGVAKLENRSNNL